MMNDGQVPSLVAESSTAYPQNSPADPISTVQNADDAARLHFIQNLLVWYASNKRTLPWRQTKDPYSIWVSEMMLQQTQVATVIPYWTRWMERFPTVAALASAPIDDVLKQWQGLGYYARARNLHRAAQVIVEKHGGVFPERYDEVLALPGIGPYTAGAICSIALGQETPIVDANVIRVLCRYFGLTGDPKSPAVQERLWTLAKELIPIGQSSDFNQGMMELGALICHSKPECHRCPVQENCFAFLSGRTESLPEFAPKPVFTTQVDVSAILTLPGDSERYLLVQRPAEGLWGGLWEFPRVTQAEEESVAGAAERAVREIAGLTATASATVLATVRHGVTTRKITLIGLECRLTGPSIPRPADGFTAIWASLPEIDRLALSSPQTRLLAQITAARNQLSLFS